MTPGFTEDDARTVRSREIGDRFSREAPEELHALLGALVEAGHTAHVVGGSIRDLAMGRPPVDWDVATDAHPRQVGARFARSVQVNARHGTTQVRIGSHAFEVTTYRLEGPYGDGRRPDYVRFASRIEDDLSRRDFTVNAMAFEPTTGTLVDPHGGLADLDARLIRAVGDPATRFREDALRILRAARFAATLELEIDAHTMTAMRTEREALGAISAERIRDELVKGLRAARPSIMIEAMRTVEILEPILPELAACAGVTQNAAFHAYDVYTHSIIACDEAPAARPLVRLAALLHDVGKAPTRDVHEGRITFYGHEQIGARMVIERLSALRFPRKDVREVAHLVAHHMFHYEPEWTDAAVRRFVARVGLEPLDDLFALRRADVAAKGTEDPEPEGLDELRARIDAECAREAAFRVEDLAVAGTDVMRELDLTPGPDVGRVLGHLLAYVLEGGENTREALLAEARRVTPGERGGQ